MTRVAWLFCVLGLIACGKVVVNDNPDAAPDSPPDPCTTNVCECTVATQAQDCTGAHQICDESGPGRVCACAPLYGDSNGACVFQGAPADPGFEAPDVWTLDGPGVSIDTSAVGNIDPGLGLFAKDAICQFSAFRQTVRMPPGNLAEPLKLVVTHTAVDNNFELGQAFLSIGVNGEFHDTRVTAGSFVTESFCLGPRIFGEGPIGSDVEFQVGVLGGEGLCNNPTPMANIRIDHVALEVAAPGECPMPNTVVNGDMEGPGGWTFSGFQSGTGAILANIGEAGTKGAQLSLANRCSEVTMTGTIALPSAIANPAIDLFMTGTAGSRLDVQLGGQNIAILPGSNQAVHRRVCVPEWASGTIQSLGFFFQRVSNNACSTALARSFTLDNISIVDDPACAPVPVIDAGFENSANGAGPVTGWGLVNGYVNDTEGASAVINNSPANAHAGVRSLQLSGINECVFVGTAGADFSIIVPEPSGTEGPAIKFFSNVGNGNVKTLTRLAMVIPGNFQSQTIKLDLPETGVYESRVLCLPPKTRGRRMGFRFSLGDPDGGGCTTNFAQENAFIDDVSIGTDPSCPAQ